MPIGFYKRVNTNHISISNIVAVCLPKKVAAIALQRHYLRPGHCPSGVIPVLKQVIAVPGDTVRLTNKNIVVNDKPYFAPYAPFDHNGESVHKSARNGLYQSTHGYWLYGSHDPVKSWDSRYYGAISKTEIVGVYKPLLTF